MNSYPCSFTSAGGKPHMVSDAALNEARTKMVGVVNGSGLTVPEPGNPETSQSTDSQWPTESVQQECLIGSGFGSSGFPQMGFMSASGKSSLVSDKALSKARALLSEDAEPTGDASFCGLRERNTKVEGSKPCFQLTSGITTVTPKVSRIRPVIQRNTAPSSFNSPRFVAPVGNLSPVSNRIKSALAEFRPKTAPKEIESGFGQSYGGFMSAAGTRHKVSAKALENVKDLFSQEIPSGPELLPSTDTQLHLTNPQTPVVFQSPVGSKSPKFPPTAFKSPAFVNKRPVFSSPTVSVSKSGGGFKPPRKSGQHTQASKDDSGSCSPKAKRQALSMSTSNESNVPVCSPAQLNSESEVPVYIAVAETQLNLSKTVPLNYFHIKGFIRYIRPENFWYKACPMPNCRKKLVAKGRGNFYCERCEDYCDDFIPVLLLSKEAIRKIFHAALFKEFLFRLQAKLDTWAGRRTVKWQCVKLRPLDVEWYTEHVTKELRKLES